ncbi:hypothetical protein QR680_003944 [Steinernema hermaphroditum]|uniref:UmuC domain-containing protein n=1 Tax=Steinernema hermaphroditum TaxID=289476 RepID=A0AA39HN72_9BILA|nr:hypothetical protein QR680_003944 [Steinernema hermaphroditum]
MDQYVEILELDRNLQRTAIHVDMDAFYAAVEIRETPGLRVVPIAVDRSDMLCTSNYIARKYGVRAAMPGFIAKKLCPQLKIVPTNFKKYTYVSGIVQGIFRQYDPNLRMASLDEAYMDITDYSETKTQPAAVKRVRHKGQSICRLPLIQDGDTMRSRLEQAQKMSLMRCVSALSKHVERDFAHQKGVRNWRCHGSHTERNGRGAPTLFIGY